jgi:hypothetical protein
VVLRKNQGRHMLWLRASATNTTPDTLTKQTIAVLCRIGKSTMDARERSMAHPMVSSTTTTPMPVGSMSQEARQMCITTNLVVDSAMVVWVLTVTSILAMVVEVVTAGITGQLGIKGINSKDTQEILRVNLRWFYRQQRHKMMHKKTWMKRV